MNKTFKSLTKLSQIIMLMTSLLLLNSCMPKHSNVVVIPEDRAVKKLPNGNYEVTPAWLKDRYSVERTLLLQLEKCEKNP